MGARYIVPLLNAIHSSELNLTTTPATHPGSLAIPENLIPQGPTRVSARVNPIRAHRDASLFLIIVPLPNWNHVVQYNRSNP